jgi:DNA-binding LytR/AlgR family response regulator
MKIALVDDEITQLQNLRQLLATELNALLPHMPHQIDGYRNGQTFLEHWQPGRYDVVILDIFMGGITGVDVAKEIRRTDQNVKLVFCSRSNEFAAESYQVNAQYYLVKPATAGSIASMLQRLNLELIQLGQSVTLPDGHPVILRRILYTECYNHVVSVHMKDQEIHHLRTSHAQIEELLTACGYIVSPSKGILVNFHEVTGVTSDSFTLSDGSVVPISRRKSKDIMAAYTQFRFQKLRSEVTA